MSRPQLFEIVTCQDCDYNDSSRILPSTMIDPSYLEADLPGEGDPCPRCGGQLDHDTDFIQPGDDDL